MITDGRIRMTDAEYTEFQALVPCAQWIPRTPEEFNAMCDLAVAGHRADTSSAMGEIFAQGILAAKFDAKGNANFPIDQRKIAYGKVHGTWPTQEQLEAFEQGPRAHAGLTLAVDNS